MMILMTKIMIVTIIMYDNHSENDTEAKNEQPITTVQSNPQYNTQFVGATYIKGLSIHIVIVFCIYQYLNSVYC